MPILIAIWGGDINDRLATAAARAQVEDFRMGAVFGRALGILWRHALLFIPLCSLAGLPDLLTSRARSGAQGWGGSAGTQVLRFLLESLVQAMVVYAAFEDMRGGKVHLWKSLKIGITRFFPVIVASIGIGVAIALGFLLLIVPGLIALASLYLTISVCVVERCGPFESAGRSAALTKGHRAKMLGIAALPLLAVATGAGIIEAMLPPGAKPLVAFVWEALLAAYTAVLAVVAYHDLRRAKEGVDAEQIIAVFE